MNTRNTTRTTFFTRFFTATIATAALAAGAMAQFPPQNTNIDPMQLEQMYNELSRGNYDSFLPNASDYLGGMTLSANPSPILNNRKYILTLKVDDANKLKGRVRLSGEYQYISKKTGKTQIYRFNALMKVIDKKTAVFEGKFSFNTNLYIGSAAVFQVLTPDYDQMIATFVLK